MKYLRVLAVLGICLIAVPVAHAQRVVVGVGVGPVVVAGPPVCAYGYYSYYPYACAPYGYYGPDWFVSGVFIGAGPWYHGYYGRPGWYGRDWDRRGWHGRDGYYGRHDFDGRRGFEGRGDFHGRSEFRGGSNFHGGGGFHGGGHGRGHR
jgi:hypothetical protein